MKRLLSILALFLVLLPLPARAAKTLVVLGQSSAVSNTTGYLSPIVAAENITTTEANVALTIRSAFTASGLYVRVTSNASVGTSTWKTRKNTADGAQSVSIPTVTTGEFEDAVNTDSLAAADTFALAMANSGVGNIAFKSASYIVDASSNTIIFVGATNNLIFSSNASTVYVPLLGRLGSSTTESDVQTEINSAGTLSKLYLRVSTNNRAVVDTFGSRKNTANGNLVISTIASTTGTYEDTTNSDTIAANDSVNFYVTGGASAVSLIAQILSVTSETTNSTFLTGGGFASSPISVANGVTAYFPVGPANSSETTTESNVSSEVHTAFNFSNLWLRLATNATTATSTFDLRKNQTSTGMPTISIGSGATGTFEDAATTGTFSSATDEINLRMVNGGGGAMTYRLASLKGSVPIVSTCPRTLALMGVGC